MKTASLSLIPLALAVACADAPDVSTNRVALERTFTMDLDGVDNDQIPAVVHPIVDEYSYYLADVDFLGRSYRLEFTINPDNSRILTLADQAPGGGLIDATEDGDAYSLSVTIGGATTTYTHDAPPVGPGLPDTAETAALLIAFDIPDDLEWVPDLALVEDVEPTAYAGPKGKRNPKVKNPKPVKGTPKTCPKPGKGAVIVAGCAVALTLCLGSELTCNGPQTFHCPDGTTVSDPCGCGQSVCNKCLSTCSDECVVGEVPCPKAKSATTAEPSGR